MDEGLLVGESGMEGVCDVSKLFFFFFSSEWLNFFHLSYRVSQKYGHVNWNLVICKGAAGKFYASCKVEKNGSELVTENAVCPYLSELHGQVTLNK